MKKLLFLIGCLLFIQHLLAQGGVQGKVTDETGTLPGVNILIKGTDKGTITNLEGNFTLTGIPAGEHTLLFKYVGLQDKEVPLFVKSDEIINLGEISMQNSSLLLNEVIITSTFLAGQMKAMKIQQEAPSILNVLSADAIGKLPDRNAAEAIQRLPGVALERDQGEGRYISVRGTPLEWSSSLINGSRMASAEDRTIPLDIFPSELIERVELAKALTPDMEGDGIGGNVDFITRKAPDKRIITGSLATGINEKALRPVYNASVLLGDRIGKFGFLVSGGLWERAWASDNVENDYNYHLSGKDAFSLSNLQLRQYDGTRHTYGLNVSTEYKLNEGNRVFFTGMYNRFADDEYNVMSTYNFPDFTKNETTGSLDYGIRSAKYITNLGGIELGGNHKIEKWSFGWGGNFFKTNYDMQGTPDDIDPQYKGLYFSYFQQTGLTFDGLAAGRKFLKPDHPGGDDGDGILPHISSSTPVKRENLNFYRAMSLRMKNKESVFNAYLNLNYQFLDKLDLKIGGKVRGADRENMYAMTMFMMPNFQKSLANFDKEEFPHSRNYLRKAGERGGMYVPLIIDPIRQEESTALIKNPSDFNYILRQDRENGAEGSNYQATENIYSGYLMGTWKIIPQLTFIGGMRVEHTALSYHGYARGAEDKASYPVSAKNNYTSLLPMFHLKYTPIERLNLRLAVTRTMARPNYADLTPSQTQSIAAANTVIIKGNPDLKPTYSLNLDLMGEYYFKNFGMVSAGVFYKDITNPIFEMISHRTDVNGNAAEVHQPLNNDKAKLWGFELGLSKRLDFLQGFFGGFGIEANYTYTGSEFKLPGREEKQRITKQAPHVFNAALYYEQYGISVRLAVNYKGSYVDAIQGENYEHDRWYDKNVSLDASLAYRFNQYIRIFAEAQNLLNAPLRYYHGNSDRPEQVEYYSWKGMAGLTLTF